MPFVVCDTNIVDPEQPLGSNALRLLLDAAGRGQITLVIPELIIRETANKWAEKAEERVKEARKQTRKLEDQGLVATLPGEEEIAAGKIGIEEALREKVDGEHVIAPPLPEVPHDSLVARALERRQPFDRQGKDGYRDSLLWGSVLELAEGDDVLLLSKDRVAFAGENKEKLSPALAREVEERTGSRERVALFTDANDLVEKFSEQDAEARHRIAHLVRVESFLTIFTDSFITSISGYRLRPAEVAALGFPTEPIMASVEGADSLGRVSVLRSYAISDHVGLAELEIFAAVDITFFAPTEQINRFQVRDDVAPVHGDWGDVMPTSERDIPVITYRLARVEAQAAIRLIPGTVERIEVSAVEPISADQWQHPEEAVEEEPPEGWEADAES